MTKKSILLLLASLPTFIPLSGCDFAWKVIDRVTESPEDRYERTSREEAKERRREEAKSIENRDLTQFLETKECSDCVLKELDFAGKNFENSKLRKSHLIFVSAEDANFRNSDFRDATFHGNLNGLDIRGSRVWKAAFLGATSMKSARLDGLDLKDVDHARLN